MVRCHLWHLSVQANQGDWAGPSPYEAAWDGAWVPVRWRERKSEPLWGGVRGGVVGELAPGWVLPVVCPWGSPSKSLPVKSGDDRLIIGVLVAFPVLEFCTPMSRLKAWLPWELRSQPLCKLTALASVLSDLSLLTRYRAVHIDALREGMTLFLTAPHLFICDILATPLRCSS